MKTKRKKILLIINPKAGRIKSMTVLSDILGVFGDEGYETKAFRTKRRHDATAIVRRHAPKFDIVVCCGGDGTLNEVITGLITLDNPPAVGYIPMGTSNDFATSLGLSTDATEAARNILKGKIIEHDIGSFNAEQCFSFVASFGTLSDVSYLTPQKMKNLLGHFAYKLQGAKDFFKMRAHHARVEFDGQVVEGDFLLGGVSNAKSIGGMIRLKSEKIVLNDGVLEIICIRKPKNIKEVYNIADWLITQRYDNKCVLYRHAKSVRFTSDEYIAWTVDGEFAGFEKEVRVECLHGKIRFLGCENNIC